MSGAKVTDARVTLARPDLARAELEGVIRAGRFVDAEPRQVSAPLAAIRKAPDAGAELLDQALFGERMDIAEVTGDFAWAQARRDGYVGFVATAELGEVGALPTHRISAPATFAFAEPRVQARPFGPLSMNTLVAVEEESGPYARCAGAGWIARRHLAPIGVVETDFVAVAEQFVGVPYLWGGRATAGLDCSGLVLQALYACGRACPRDTDQQAALGTAADPAALRRGDLVFWRGHVGVMLDGERLLHANAHHMAVGVEPLAEAVARIGATPTGQPTAYRRP
jgi:cell wall-associated NlpC family hydrolase